MIARMKGILCLISLCCAALFLACNGGEEEEKECQQSSDCGAPTPICDTDTWTCVECVEQLDCDDGIECTEDLCTQGACSNENYPDGTTCSDDDYCTQNDVCTAGVCTGQAVDCSHLDDQCNLGVCDPQSGDCQAVLRDSQWKLEADGGTDCFRVENGELIFDCTDCGSPNLEYAKIYVENVTGDFDATFTYSDRVGSDPAIVKFFADDPEDFRSHGEAAIKWGTASTEVSCRVGGGGLFDTSTSNSGTLRIQRTGSQLSITATDSDAREASCSDAFATVPLEIGLSFYPPSSGPFSIHFSDFTITGGGDVSSDTFDCGLP